LAEEAEEAKFVLEEEDQSFATTFLASACPSHSVDVVFRIIWRVVLDDPVNFREIQASLCDISAQQDSLLCLAELEISGSSLLLLLLSMDILDRHVHIVQKVGVELDSITRRHEDHDLLVQLLAQKGEEQLEFVSSIDTHVALL
jgi:hypothetical protein